MSEAELYAAAPRLGPELTARLLDERQRLQNPDDLADAKLDSDTLARLARAAGFDPGSDVPEDRQILGELRQRAQQIFASEQRSNSGRPLGWEAKQGILKQLIDEDMSDTLIPAVDRRFFQPGQENAPPGNLSKTLENLLYTRPEGEAPAGLLKLLNGAGEAPQDGEQAQAVPAADSVSNNPTDGSSNPGETAGSFQVAAQGGTKAQQPQPVPASGGPSATIPGLPDIPKDLHGVPLDLIALLFGAAADQEPALMEAVANTIKNRIGLNVYGFANLNSYDDVIYQMTSIVPWFDNEGYPILDENDYFIPGHPAYQFNEVADKQMELAYNVLTGAAKVSALGGADNEDALTDAFERAEKVFHGTARDNTIPPQGGRGAVFFHDTSIPTPPFIARRIALGDMRELFPAGQNAGIRFYGYTEQGYQRDRIKK